MKPFDWKRKFSASLTMIDSNNGFERYHLENETGDGTIIACEVFSGVQAVKIDMRMGHCDNLIKLDKRVIEMAYCSDGLFESAVNDRYFHFLSAGDFAMGYAGKKESHGDFPTRKCQGIIIFLETETFTQKHATIHQDLSIDIKQLHALASSFSHCFMLYQDHKLNSIATEIAHGFTTSSIPLLKIKVLELLTFLSGLTPSDTHNILSYPNKNQATLAKSAHKLLTDDLSRHITIEQLAAVLKTGLTTLKMSFKNVYGMPVYQYQKELRLQKAQQLLRETSLSVSAIASEIGYSNPAKFSTAFKKRFDISPTEYKKQHREHKE